MRRIVRNTTAIAACLSLLLPQLSQAFVINPASAGRSADGHGDAPLRLAQAEREEPPVRRGQAQRAERQNQPKDERKPQRSREQAQEAKPRQDRGQSKEAPARQAEERREQARKPAAQQGDERPQRERQRREAAQDKQEAASPRRGPAQERAQQERRLARTQERAEQDQKDKNPRRAEERQRSRQGGEAAPRRAQAERRERDQNRDRPAARAQEAERPAQRQSERQSPAARPDDNGGRQGAHWPAEAKAQGEQTVRDARQREQQQQRNVTTRGEGTPQRAAQPAPKQARAAEADARQTEAARQAAGEKRAARAAALNEDQRGEIVEQRITRENSRSSNEDFETSLRDAVQARDQQRTEARNDNDDDDDNNDLARALLLGLGAVAVGSYLNNNRQVALSAPDRVVVTRADGSQEVIKDEVALLRQPGSTVATENFDDGSSRTVVTRADGSRVVTIRDADLGVLRRTLVSPDGTQTRLIDDTAEVESVDIATLPAPAPVYNPGTYDDETALREAFRREGDIDRRFSLGQVRNIPEVRSLVAPVNIDAITFDSGSAAISPDQARQLSTLGGVIQDAIAQNPREVFLIEGHTDLVGPDAANLALSDRRAESVALALSEYFQVPPENLVVQGYGEQYPQVRQEGDIRENRRAAVRRITDLLQTADAQ
jgi:outer membrane protein OmpA-like peptidoglycan-associated protein